MTIVQKILVLIPIAYLVGSIPFGLLVGFVKGVDVRTAGSKNIGATNVARLLGKQFFFLVFTLDFLKSFVPVMIAGMLIRRDLGTDPSNYDSRIYLLWLLVGFAAIMGHMFSVFIGFKGGKGVATGAGVIFGLFPFFTYPGLIAFGVWVVFFLAKRYISLASIVASLSFSVIYLIMGIWMRWPVFGAQLPLLMFAVLIGAMITWKHRTNIARLRAGTESKVGAKKIDPATTVVDTQP